MWNSAKRKNTVPITSPAARSAIAPVIARRIGMGVRAIRTKSSMAASMIAPRTIMIWPAPTVPPSIFTSASLEVKPAMAAAMRSEDRILTDSDMGTERNEDAGSGRAD